MNLPRTLMNLLALHRAQRRPAWR